MVPDILSKKLTLALHQLKERYEAIPPHIKLIIIYFLSTRLVLIIIGTFSRLLLQPFHGRRYVWHYSKILWLDIWGVWDTGHYLNIAKNWYPVMEHFTPAKESVIAFFPVYPGLMKLLGYIIGNHFYAGLLISNISLFIAAVYLFKLVRLDFSDSIALRSIKYLFLFPTAFIYSGAFSESLFLALLLACFYYALQNKWFLVGILGFFLGLSRAPGIVMLLPLIVIYGKQKDWNIARLDHTFLGVLGVVFGFSAFMALSYYYTGDFLAFVHVQQAWERSLTNPITSIMTGLSHPRITMHFFSWFFLGCFLLLLASIRKIPFAYWLATSLIVVVPVMTSVASIPRLALPGFALYLYFAVQGENEIWDQSATIALALLQGFLMVFWANGFHLIV